MNDPTGAPTIARIALNPTAAGRLAALVAALQAEGAEYVLPAPPDLRLPDGALATISAAARSDPEAAAFRLTVKGLTPDPLWRGRRCRAHARNLESLRFAHLIAPGALVIRREALLAALVGLPPGADWWQAVCRRIARAGRIADLDVTVRRGALMEGESACPSFTALGQPARVLVLGQIEVSTSLYFDFLESTPDLSVDFRAFTRLQLDAPVLAAADLVVLVRELHRFWDEGVIAFLEAAGTPYVWFTDDNFLALRAEHDAPAFYTEARMSAALAGAAEVWTSTPALAAAHAWLHPAVRVWSPVLDPALEAAALMPSGPFTIALAGGDFRLAGLAGPTLETLKTIVAERQTRLILTPAAAALLRPALPGAEIVTLGTERSFRQFVRIWRRYRPDILLHPTGATVNAPYKCPTAAIVAHHLSAVPVVADEPAYDGWSETDGLLRLEVLASVADRVSDSVWRGDMAARLTASLASRFDEAGRTERLIRLARPPRPRKAVAVAENILESPRFGRRRLALSLAHIGRRFSRRG